MPLNSVPRDFGVILMLESDLLLAAPSRVESPCPVVILARGVATVVQASTRPASSPVVEPSRAATSALPRPATALPPACPAPRSVNAHVSTPRAISRAGPPAAPVLSAAPGHVPTLGLVLGSVGSPVSVCLAIGVAPTSCPVGISVRGCAENPACLPSSALSVL